MTEELETVHPIVRSAIPVRQFHDLDEVVVMAVFPDRRRMATSSSDGMVRLWDLKTGGMLMELEGRGAAIRDMALSCDGKLIATSDNEGYVIAWHGDTGRKLTQAFEPYPGLNSACPLDFSPDGTTIATGSYGTTLWSTETWQLKSKLNHGHYVTCVRYSPSGKLLSLATSQDNILIWDPATNTQIAILHTDSPIALVWTPDGTRLLSGGRNDTIIREWDSSTWTQISNIWKGRTEHPWRFAMNCDGTVVAFPTTNNCVRLVRLSDRQSIAVFQHSNSPRCTVFTMDGKYILTGSKDSKISEWAVPGHGRSQDTTPHGRTIYQVQDYVAKTQGSDTKAQDFDTEDGYLETKACFMRILAMNTTVRDACINGDLTTAEDMLTQEIDAHDGNYRSYTSRSVVMARKLDWDRALDDATKSLSIQPSLAGYISKAIALCGKKRVRDARNAFDLAFTFIGGDSKTTHAIYLIKSIALFNANRHAEAMKRLRELAATCPNADTILACRTIEVYMHIQLGNSALSRADATEAANHFTAAVNAGTFLLKLDVQPKYEEFTVLFGCDFTSLWQTANRQRCHALLRAGKITEVFEAYRYMADMSNESMKASCLDWTIGFMQEMSAFQGNVPKADAIPEIMTRQNDDDDEKDSISISDIDSDIDHVEDVVC